MNHKNIYSIGTSDNIYSIGTSDNTQHVANVNEPTFLNLLEIGVIIDLTSSKLKEEVKGNYSDYVLSDDIYINLVKNNELPINKEIQFIIDKLNDVKDLDGETMQFILREVGMEDQMLRQLMMSQPIEEVRYIIDEREELEEELDN